MSDKQDTDATHILTADHRKVDQLFEKYAAASGNGSKKKIAGEICDELKIHTLIEEEIFYPALRGKIEDDLLNEAHVEHDSAKVLINEIVSGGPDEAFYDAKVTVLKELVQHHVKEEESQRDNMFQQARASKVDLKELGKRMLMRKQELKTMARTSGLPQAQPTTH